MRNSSESGLGVELANLSGRMPREFAHENSEVLEISNLFNTTEPTALQERVEGFLKDSADSEAEMTRLADELSRRNQEMDEASGVSAEAAGSKVLKSADEIWQVYEKVVKNKKKVAFASFLKDYLEKEVLPRFFKKYSDYMAGEGERLDMEREKEDLNKTKEQIRAEILESINVRPAVNYSPEDQKQISRIKYGFHQQDKLAHKEDVEIRDKVHEEERLLVFILDKLKLFGDRAKVHQVSEYDDYVTHADFVVDPGEGLPILLVDLTHAETKLGDKITYNLENPLRTLKYPLSRDIANRAGVPIVLGMGFANMQQAMESFLEESARERLSDKKMSHKTKGFEFWVTSLSKQLLYQRRLLNEHALGAREQSEKERFEKAVQAYNEMINYFKELEKEKYPPKDNSNEGRNSWERRLLNIEAEIASLRSGITPRIEGV